MSTALVARVDVESWPTQFPELAAMLAQPVPQVGTPTRSQSGPVAPVAPVGPVVPAEPDAGLAA